MTEPVAQRWGTVPSAEATAKWALRSAPAAWARGDEARVRGFMARQMDATIQSWLFARSLGYAERLPSLEPAALDREAMLDLFCWQRRIGKPGEALTWLREYELMAGSAERGAK